MFGPSTVPHPWREALALFAVCVWSFILFVQVLDLLVRLCARLGPVDWYTSLNA